MIRVVVAEDSLTVRELLVELLRGDPEIQVVGEAKNGAEAVEVVERLRPDLIAMDIHMPIMDGLEATREIMTRAPTPIVLVTSSASRADAALSFDALRAGALTLVSKPDNPASERFNGRRDELLTTVKSMAAVKVVRRWPERARAPARVSQGGPAATHGVAAIAASTGGPAALAAILGALPSAYRAPTLVVQHMAAGFTQALAEWLGAGCTLQVTVASPGEPLRERTVYLAPDARHLGVSADGRIELSDAAPIGGHRPSATHLFRSVAQAFGDGVVAVILTGMGRDGVDGLAAVRAAGGRIIAQDEATSIVYGMPGETVRAGLADAVLPLDAIPTRLSLWARKDTGANARPGR